MGELTSPLTQWPGGRTPREVDLAVEPIDLPDEGAVWSAIRAFGEAEGWICRPHEVVAWPGTSCEGPVLSAELATSDGRSLHIRWTGSGWRGWRYRESEGQGFLVFHERYRGTVPDHPERHLGYAEYWSLRDIDGIKVYQPYTARFTGWEGA